MIRHIVLWSFKDELSADKKAAQAAIIKVSLEALRGVVPGLLKLTVQYPLLGTSNADLMLDSLLESPEALEGYSVHPAHVKAANEYVRPFIKSRLCANYEV